MQVFLELSGHPKANVRRVVVSRNTLVGRSKDCALQIASASVSRKHCELRVGDAGVSVIDLGSSNGTFIDADRLAPGDERPLPAGSRLNVGGIRFVVTYAAPIPKAAAGAPVPAQALTALEDDVILADGGSFLFDEESLSDGPVGSPAAVEKTAAVPAIDDEPDLSAMFADGPEPAAGSAASPDPIDDPILGSDEEDAFSFLTDDEPDAPVAGAARPDDSRVTL